MKIWTNLLKQWFSVIESSTHEKGFGPASISSKGFTLATLSTYSLGPWWNLCFNVIIKIKVRVDFDVPHDVPQRWTSKSTPPCYSLLRFYREQVGNIYVPCALTLIMKHLYGPMLSQLFTLVHKGHVNVVPPPLQNSGRRAEWQSTPPPRLLLRMSMLQCHVVALKQMTLSQY